MNRNFTLILSALLVVVLLGIWIYLMFFADSGAEEEVIVGSGEYAEFEDLGGDAPAGGGEGGQSGNEAGGSDDNITLGPNGTPVELPVLRQLTTRNVIGYQEIDVASTTHIVFMESGVGHIYRIDLATGFVERISATTIPDARAAAFSKNGDLVAVKTGADTGINPLLLAEVDSENDTVNLTEVAERVGEFTFTGAGNLLYTTATNNSVVAQSFDPDTGSSETLFTTPFREVVVLFGASVDAPHYFFPKTSYDFEGFIYEVNVGQFERLPLDGFGFSAALLGDTLLTSERNQGELVTNTYALDTGEITALEVATIPEKCVVDESNKLYCARPSDRELRYDSINSWLQGVVSYADNLWEITDDSRSLVNVTSFSGRQVDVMNGTVGPISNDWYFQNKNDNSLWIYELSRLSQSEIAEEENI